MVGDQFDFFAHEVVSGVADAGVSVPVVGRVFGATRTLAIDLYIVPLTETTVFIQVLVLATGRHLNRHT